MDSDNEDVLHDCDFLLQLAEEAMTERMVAKGQVEAPKPPAGTAPYIHHLASLAVPTQPARTTAVAKPAGKDNAFYVEPMSGLKVSRPVLGSVIVRERLHDRLFVKLANVRQVLSEVGADWVTLAVVASKTQQEARNGGFYSRWQLSDLDGASVTLFVFGQAHKELYMLEQGSVILLETAKAAKDKQGGGVSLTIEKPEHVTRVGQSPDFMLCKGTKTDGSSCRQVVNASRCDYCPYHAAQALKQLQSHRPDLRGRSLLEQQLRPQAMKADPWNRRDLETRLAAPKPTTAIVKPLPNSQKSSSMTAGATNPALGGVKRSSAASTQTQELLADVELSDGDDENQGVVAREGGGEPSAGISVAKARLLAAVTAQRSTTPTASTQRTATPAPRSTTSTAYPVSTPPQPQLYTAQKLSTQGVSGQGIVHACTSQQQQLGSASAPPGQRGLQASSSQHNVSASRLPAAGLRPGGITSVSGAATTSNIKSAVTAKAKEQSKMMSSLGLKRPAPSSNSNNSGGTNRSVTGGRGAAVVAAAKSGSLGVGGMTGAGGASSAMAAAFGAVVQRATQEGSQKEDPVSLQSRYHDLHEEGSWDEVTDMLEIMEKRDALVQQMDSVKVLKVSAFQCTECNMFTEYRRKECKDHQVTRVTTNKRFWLCGHCNARSTSLGVIYPKKRCPKCNDPSMDFKPATMYSGPQGAKPAMEGTGIAARENMMTRGVEHGFHMTGR